MAGKLVAEEGPLRELVLSFEEGSQWIIGRDPDASQLLVEDAAVSRSHLLCRKTPEGIVVENLSTTNPVYVNDELLTESRLLNHGDTIKIGNTTFRFYNETVAELFEDIPAKEPTIGNIMTTPHEETPKAGDEHVPSEEQVLEEKPRDTIFEEEEKAAEMEGREIANINFELLEPGRWLLKVINGPNSGAEFSMQTGNNYVIGTDPNSCDIVFYDNSVSRQHARITVNEEDNLSIEDLKSRNGTMVDGALIETRLALTPQSVVAMGTTSFVVYDREGEMQTIIAPLMPSIVKVLQKEEPQKVTAEPPAALTAEAAIPAQPTPVPPVPEKAPTHAPGTFILVGILIGLFAIIGYGISTLFQQTPVVIEQPVDTEKALNEALGPFPAVKYSYNKATGRLLLVGHVLTSADRSQLLYNLQGLRFIKDIDDSGVIIDEYVWREANQLLASNSKWQGITVHSPEAGHFVLLGYLQTRQEAEQVWEYMTRNFPYLDLLENRLVIEEDILSSVTTSLREKGLNNVSVQITGGELTLTGTLPAGKAPVLEEIISKLKEMTGIRVVKNFVTETAHQESIINISDKYLVTGSSRSDGGNLNVIINGRILSQGDILDGMTITEIQSNYVMLEKDGVRYRIDYSR